MSFQAAEEAGGGLVMSGREEHGREIGRALGRHRRHGRLLPLLPAGDHFGRAASVFRVRGAIAARASKAVFGSDTSAMLLACVRVNERWHVCGDCAHYKRVMRLFSVLRLKGP